MTNDAQEKSISNFGYFQRFGRIFPGFHGNQAWKLKKKT